jgi:hypothetical protein
MEMRTDLWHVRLYFWAERLKQTFRSSDEYIEVSATSNICVYIRTLCWSVAALALYVASATYGLSTFLYKPSMYFGWTYWMVIGGILIVFVGAGVILFFIDSATNWFHDWSAKRRELSENARRTMEGDETHPSILTVVKKYIDDQAHGICTEIKFVAPVSNEDKNGESSRDVFHVAVAKGAVLELVPETTTSEVRIPVAPVRWVTTTRIGFLPVWWKLLLLIVVTTLFAVMFKMMNNEIVPVDARWSGECVKGQYEDKGGVITLNVSCDGESVAVTNRKTIVAMLNNDTPPMCFRSVAGKFYCDIDDQSRMKMVGQ